MRIRSALRPRLRGVLTLLSLIGALWLASRALHSRSEQSSSAQSSGGSRAARGTRRMAVSKQASLPGISQLSARRPTNVTLCSDTCPTARDGQCGEGRVRGSNELRPLLELPVVCDLGTDCGDCGPWVGPRPASPSWREPALPVATATNGGGGQLNLTMKVARTLTNPSFLFAYTDERVDPDVSGQVHQWGALEGGITRVVRHALEGRCGGFRHDAGAAQGLTSATAGGREGGEESERSDGQQEGEGPPGLVLDVGANFGWFALYAAAMGCRVIAWEPVPTFRAFLEYSAARSGLSHLIDIRGAVVGSRSGQVVRVAVPTAGLSLGTASVAGQNLRPGQVSSTVEVVTESLDEVVGPEAHVALVKVDVEGYEHHALASASQLLATGRVDHIVMEYSPGVYDGSGPPNSSLPAIQMLVGLLRQGYSMVQLYDLFAKMPMASTSSLPVLPLVTLDNLQYDLEDAAHVCDRLRARPGTLTTLKTLKGWPNTFTLTDHECRLLMPFWSHPKSLRATFGHNTNLWARRIKAVGGEQRTTLTPRSTQQNASAPRSWGPLEVHPRTRGVMMRACADVQPHDLILFRCPCTHKECEQEAKVFDRLVQGNAMPQMYDL